MTELCEFSGFSVGSVFSARSTEREREKEREREEVATQKWNM